MTRYQWPGRISAAESTIAAGTPLLRSLPAARDTCRRSYVAKQAPLRCLGSKLAPLRISAKAILASLRAMTT